MSDGEDKPRQGRRRGAKGRRWYYTWMVRGDGESNDWQMATKSQDADERLGWTTNKDAAALTGVKARGGREIQ